MTKLVGANNMCEQQYQKEVMDQLKQQQENKFNIKPSDMIKFHGWNTKGKNESKSVQR